MRALLWLVAMIAGFAMPTRGLSAPARPNVVLFLADDLGWSDPSINGGRLATPNMERLAKEGMKFNYAFVASPSCAPSRAALLTGLHTVHNGAMFNHAKPIAEIKKWPAYFQELGYETAAIGKTAHYAQVKDYGFDYFSHFAYHDDACIGAACDWLAGRQSDKPLCLIVGTNWPHVPWPDKGIETPSFPSTFIDTPETRKAYGQYAAAVANADRDLGLVYDAVRAHLHGDTLFLFTSDHGAQWPFGKWNCYDAGIRTPLVAVWPGKIQAGSVSDAMVSWIDLLPTCLEAAGGELPADLDGESFLGVLTGKVSKHRDLIFTTHSGDGKMNEYPIRAVRSRDWLYLRNLAPDREHHTHIDLAEPDKYWNSWVAKAGIDAAAKAIVQRYHHRPEEELYDLRNDPHEQRNRIADADPAAQAEHQRLKNALQDWMESQGDKGLETELAVRPKAPARK